MPQEKILPQVFQTTNSKDLSPSPAGADEGYSPGSEWKFSGRQDAYLTDDLLGNIQFDKKLYSKYMCENVLIFELRRVACVSHAIILSFFPGDHTLL
jgi:hypothetical protein